MSIDTLKDIYADEMKDLWSANDQMAAAVKDLAAEAHDDKLRQTLEASVTGIEKHAAILKTLLGKANESQHPEHCKGMSGLVKEAKKHTSSDSPKQDELMDLVIIAQYQRMSHYGIAGFGTAAAYAKALGKTDDAAKLKQIVSEIYKGDEYASTLAQKAEAAAAKPAKPAKGAKAA
jgi:ferritin-like metal-binding protein YciE